MEAAEVRSAEQSRNISLARTRRLPLSHASKSVSDIPADAASWAGVRRAHQRSVHNRRPIRASTSEMAELNFNAVPRDRPVSNALPTSSRPSRCRAAIAQIARTLQGRLLIGGSDASRQVVEAARPPSLIDGRTGSIKSDINADSDTTPPLRLTSIIRNWSEQSPEF